MFRTKTTALIAAMALGLVACSDNTKPKPPKPLFDEDKMVEIITDINIIEAKLNYINETGGIADSLKVTYYEQLYEHYGITKEQFTDNMRYYTQMPNELEDIMTRVVDSLTKAQGAVSQ